MIRKFLKEVPATILSAIITALIIGLSIASLVVFGMEATLALYALFVAAFVVWLVALIIIEEFF